MMLNWAAFNCTWEKWSRGFKGEYMCLYITTQMYGMIAIGIALSGYLAR